MLPIPWRVPQYSYKIAKIAVYAANDSNEINPNPPPILNYQGVLIYRNTATTKQQYFSPINESFQIKNHRVPPMSQASLA